MEIHTFNPINCIIIIIFFIKDCIFKQVAVIKTSIQF